MNKAKTTARLFSSSPHQKISKPNITFHRNLGFLEDGGRLLRIRTVGSCLYPSKKQQQRFDAETAAKDETDWGGDLDSDTPTRPN
jgi:hypothetical protein